MAVYSAHGTLVATTVATVSFALNYSLVEVVNRGTVDIFVTTNGVTPTVGGADTYVVPAASAVILTNDVEPNEPATRVANQTTVKLISSATPAYSVSGRPFPRAL